MLEEMLDEPDVRYAATDALELVAAEVERAVDPCVTSSFQAECVVLVHMLRELRPDIPVLFLDTVHHFPQTLAYRDELATVGAESGDPAGGRAGARPVADERPKACCGTHKVEPLFAALDGYDMWFTGLRREQSPSRADARRGRAVHAADRHGRCARSARSRLDGPRTSGPTRRRTTSRCCRSTSSATPASAASRARRCRSIRPTNARADGRDRSSSAASISS